MLCFYPQCLAASFSLAFRMGEGDNDAKVLLYFEIRGMNVDFSLGKGCVGIGINENLPTVDVGREV